MSNRYACFGINQNCKKLLQIKISVIRMDTIAAVSKSLKILPLSSRPNNSNETYYFYVSGQSQSFWAALKTALNFKYEI